MFKEGQQDTKALVPLFENAQAEGNLSDASRRLLERPEVQKQILIASGTPTSSIQADDVTLVTLLIDDSGSMARNKEAVVQGQNRIIDTLLQKAPYPDRILISTQVLNGGDAGVIDPYHPLAQAVRLDGRNYEPNNDTPLIPRTIEVLGGAMLKTQEGSDEWKTVRTATLVMSDGHDTSGMDIEDVAVLARDMKASKLHLLAAMGFGEKSYFTRFFSDMAIDPQWILTAEARDEEILKALGLFAEAATKAADPESFPLLLNSGYEGLKGLPGSGQINL